MPRKVPAIGEDVSHLFGGGSAPEIGDDVSHLFDAPSGLYDPKRKPVSAEDFAPAQRDVSIGHVLLNTAKSLNPLPAIKAAMADQRPEDAALGPGAVLAPFIRAAGAGAKSEAGKAAADVGRGRYSEAAGHAAAAALPMVGPAAAQAGEDIGSGETERIERGAGSAIGLVGGMVAPRVTAAVAPRVAPALATVGEQLASKGRSIAPVLKEAAKTAVVEGAAHYVGAPPLVGSALRVLLKEALSKATKAAPEVAESANAGGRVVKGSKLTDTQALADALEELRDPAPAPPVARPTSPVPPDRTGHFTLPKPKAMLNDAQIEDFLTRHGGTGPAAPTGPVAVPPRAAAPPPVRVTTPPEPSLPPGYTPRASVPPPAQPSVNAGGRLVPAQTPTVTEALVEALAETRAPAAPRITTPPELQLPAGYTPRTSAPKPKPPKAKPKLPKAVQAEIDKAKPKRAYFLKSEEALAEEAATPKTAPKGDRPYFLKSEAQLADEASVFDDAVTPSGSIGLDDLPAAWRQHTGQDLFPVTGAEGKAIADALKSELKAQGVSVEEAMARVSQNKTIPTKQRAQLIRALSQSYSQR